MMPTSELPPHSTILEDAGTNDQEASGEAATSCPSGDDIFGADPPPKTKIVLTGISPDDMGAGDRKILRDTLIDLIAAEMEYPLQNVTIEDAQS